MAHRRIGVESREAWTEALLGIPHAIAHTWGHCYAMHLSSGLPTYLYQFESGGVRVACPLAERRFQGHTDVVTPYGFGGFAGTGDCPSFPAHWAEFVAKQEYVCGYIGLNPLLVNHTYFDRGCAQADNSVFTLDLREPQEQLFAKLHANRKRQLREPLPPGTRIVWDAPRLSAFFFDRYPEFVNRVGAAPIYRFSPATLSFLCSLDGVFLVGAEVGDRLEAVAVFGHTGFVADYLFGVALPEGRPHAARLLWCGIERLRSLGVPLLNLGGGARPNDGIAEFKRRFGATEVPLLSLRQVYLPETFERLCQAAGAEPGTTGYFPPYHAPRAASGHQ
ncbi:MAG: hypothetical protein ACJ8DC_05095 [Gemmatimonadales bacterium]